MAEARQPEAKPSVSALADIIDRAHEDLQRHANELTHLELNGNDSIHSLSFRDIKFSNLESLSLKAFDPNHEALEPYLQPRLRRLRFYGMSITDALLVKVQDSCPDLEELLIENSPCLYSPESFIRFLDGARSLKTLSVKHSMELVIGTDPVFVALATKPSLEVLQFQKPITANLVSAAFEKQIRCGAGGRLFPKLRQLVCVGEPDGLRRLSPYLLQLTHLEASIEYGRTTSAEAQDSVVHSIAISCPNLLVLKLRYIDARGGKIPSQALVNLAQGNSQLKKLHIAGAKFEGFEEPHFISMVRTLPELESLSLEFSCRLTVAALIEVAENCGTTLAEFHTGAVVDLQNQVKTDVSFSKLRSFKVGRLVYPARTTATEISNTANFLKKLAPKLTVINSKFTSAFTDKVIHEVLG